MIINLQKVRERLNMTRYELARVATISPTTIQNVEGGADCKGETLIKLSNAFAGALTQQGNPTTPAQVLAELTGASEEIPVSEDGMSDRVARLSFSHDNHYYQPTSGKRITVNLKVATSTRTERDPLVHVRYFPTRAIDKDSDAMREYRKEIAEAIAPVIAKIEAHLSQPLKEAA